MPHTDAAFNLALWLVRNPAEAEDLVQDALLRAFRFFATCRADTARPWLLRIVRNVCYDWLQSRHRHTLAAFADLDPEDAGGGKYSTDAFTGPVETPESILLQRDQRQWLTAAVDALPAEFREVLVLRELEDMSYREIADITDIPIGTVMSRLSRARSILVREAKKRDDPA